MTAPVPSSAPRQLPVRTRIDVFLRLLAIQGSWNYESLSGNGIGFCLEPALRLLPGGKNTPEFNAALARESTYFNAHPYLSAIAVGALARVELDHEPPERIERFRNALCGPLGSVGDRLVWAGWLPFCSLVALAVFGLGGGPLVVLVTFLGLYNVGHFWLRIWGLRTGWALGLRVAPALANPIFRVGPVYIGRLAAFATGLGMPLALGRIIGSGRIYTGEVLVAAVCGAMLIVYLKGRIDGWRLALVALAFFVFLSVIA
jgi:mannose PTS system EIID component